MRITSAVLVSLTLFFASLTHAATAKPSHDDMFKRLSALSAKGNPEIKYNLGMFYNNGIATKPDQKAAFKLFSDAAKAGNALAAYKVGCYYAGQFPGAVEKDDDLALKFKLVAAEAGYDLAQNDVAIMLVKRNDLKGAIKWWERASRQGHDPATAFLVTYYTSKSSPDKNKGFGLMLKLRETVPDLPKKFQDLLAATEASATPEDRAAAEKVRSSWTTERTAITTAARRGIAAVPELLERNER